MEYTLSIEIEENRDVYPPSEDSVLLIESLDISQGDKVLEVGCGSGVVSLHCALNGADVICVDINPLAVKLAKENAKRNNLTLDVRESDVYSAVNEKFDTIIFNLPYLPVEEEGILAQAWSGGKDGLGPLPRLIGESKDYLLPGGKIVVVISSLMDQDALDTLLKGLETEVLGELPLFFEKLSVLKIIPKFS